MSIESRSIQFRDRCKRIVPKAAFQSIPKAKIETAAKDLNLSNDLYQWYSSAAPLDVRLPWIGDDILLCHPLKLLDNQVGYRTHGITGELTEEWHENWIVIAHWNHDPLIADVGKNHTPIFFDIHGGEWQLKQVSVSLDSFIGFLTQFIQFVGKYESINNMLDDDSILYPHVLEELRGIVNETVGNAYAENMMKFLWG